MNKRIKNYGLSITNHQSPIINKQSRANRQSTIINPEALSCFSIVDQQSPIQGSIINQQSQIINREGQSSSNNNQSVRGGVR
jgi:hypothetical protein